MEEIYMNTHSVKTAWQIPVRKNEGPGSSKKKLYVGVIIFLGLLNVLMLIGLISLGVFFHDVSSLAADLIDNKDNLTDCHQDSNDQLSVITEERDRLNATLTEMSNEMIRLQSLLKKNHNAGDIASSNLTECQQDGNKISILIEERDLLNANLTAVTQELMKLRESTCPAGWITSSVSCYYFSNEAGSWDEGRRDCIDRGADLLVMNNAEEKTFLAALIKNEAWIGLNDKETEGSWKWVDGNSPEFKNWYNSQPDNGGTSGRWGEEDCVLVNNHGKASWNDFSCDGAKHWICEKVLKLSV